MSNGGEVFGLWAKRLAIAVAVLFVGAGALGGLVSVSWLYRNVRDFHIDRGGLAVIRQEAAALGEDRDALAMRLVDLEAENARLDEAIRNLLWSTKIGAFVEAQADAAGIPPGRRQCRAADFITATDSDAVRECMRWATETRLITRAQLEGMQ